jgi:hypothetical protein
MHARSMWVSRRECVAVRRRPLCLPAQTVEIDGKRVKLQIWDTAGQVRGRRAAASIRQLPVPIGTVARIQVVG